MPTTEGNDVGFPTIIAHEQMPLQTVNQTREMHALVQTKHPPWAAPERLYNAANQWPWLDRQLRTIRTHDI